MWRKNTAGRLHRRQGRHVAADQFRLHRRQGRHVAADQFPLCLSLIQLDSILCTLRPSFHERILAALPEMHWFKWTYIHERALLFPQRCCQGHGAAIAASRGDHRNPATGSGGFLTHCWVETDGGGNGSSERQCRCGKGAKPAASVDNTSSNLFLLYSMVGQLTGLAGDPHPILSCKLEKC